MLLYNQITSLDKTQLRKTMTLFLKEDLPRGDLTTQTVVLKNQIGKYVLRSRENMVFCGGPTIQSAFSKSVKVKLLVKDGQRIGANVDIAQIKGNTREILTKERLVLNMIQHLSGVSSNTAEYVLKLSNPKIKILDTRKTRPGLRLLEKYAVNKGGGHNHRLDLSSGVMVKDNHIQNNMEEIQSKLKKLKNKIPIQIEIDSIKQINKQNVSIVDAFLLDNMSPRAIKQCIKKINILKIKSQNVFIEISGGVTLKTISKYNIEGVHGISIGALTHQSTSKDISLDQNQD
jgi:nicotinate-nucleotide pyrophosphorylase (carboxylating)